MEKEILLVVSEGNGIGNIVLISPAVQALKQIFPDSNIWSYGNINVPILLSDFNVSGLSKRDLKHMCFLSFFPKLLRTLACKLFKFKYSRFDLIVVMLFSQYLYQKNETRLHRLSGKNCLIFEYVYVDDRHESELYMELPRRLGYEGVTPPTHCSMELVPVPWGTDEKVVVISDTTSPKPEWQKKRWPYYKELAARLYEMGYKIALIGGKSEANSFDSSGWVPHYNFMDKLSLPQTAGLISQAYFFIGNDTGPAHMSGALGTPTFVIYGPSSEVKNSQLGKCTRCIKLNLPCQPCFFSPEWQECTNWQCMNLLSVENVLQEIAATINLTD